MWVLGFISLWLDLRQQPCANDMDCLFDLYSGVRTLLGNKAPSGSAVAGVLHLEEDLDGEEEDGELSLLSVGKDASLTLWRDGEDEVVGSSIFAADNKNAAVDNAAALAAIREPQKYLGLLGPEQAILPLFEFALSSANHCRSISGCETALITEIHGSKGLAAVLEADKKANSESVPIGILLKPDEVLWSEALGGGQKAGAVKRSSVPPVKRGGGGLRGGRGGRARGRGGGRGGGR